MIKGQCISRFARIKIVTHTHKTNVAGINIMNIFLIVKLNLTLCDLRLFHNNNEPFIRRIDIIKHTMNDTIMYIIIYFIAYMNYIIIK